jgi:hypothetical protein
MGSLCLVWSPVAKFHLTSVLIEPHQEAEVFAVQLRLRLTSVNSLKDSQLHFQEMKVHY